AEPTVFLRILGSPVHAAVVELSVMRERANRAVARIARVSVRVIARVVREGDAPTEQCTYRDRDRNYGCPHPATPFWLRLTELDRSIRPSLRLRRGVTRVGHQHTWDPVAISGR